MLLCVLNTDNIIINKIEAPYIYEFNQREWEDWHEIGRVYTITPPSPTQEEILSGYTSQVQRYMDSVAKTRNYDNILSLCTYATSKNPKFSKEGQAGVEWRDAVWTKCYAILAEVQAGTRSTPTDIISELPIFTWGE